MTGALRHAGPLALRSVARTLRQPAQFFPSLVFPLFLLAINAGGLAGATKIPGFPTDSYLTFALAVPFMQNAMFSAVNAGTDLALDIETGFLNRLQLTPLRAPSLLLGHLAGVAVFGLITSVVYLVVGLIAGAGFAAGAAGVLVLMLLSVLMVVGFGAIGAALALRTGSGEAVQGFFPLFFVLLFLSSMSLPRPLIGQEWFRTVATWNPVSYLVEGIRSLMITGWDGVALGRAFAVVAGLLVVSIGAAAWAMRDRLGRA